MLENTESLLPVLTQGGEVRVVCVGYEDDSLDELSQLLTTLGVQPVARVHIASKRMNPATFIGKGKIDELKGVLTEHKAQAVILDVELSPNQLRNLEKELTLPIL